MKKILILIISLLAFWASIAIWLLYFMAHSAHGIDGNFAMVFLASVTAVVCFALYAIGCLIAKYDVK